MTLHLMRYGSCSALRAVGTQRGRGRALRAVPGLLHAQPCATTNLFVPTLRRLALLCAWENPEAADSFLTSSPVLEALTTPARRAAHLRLQPVHAKGRWNGIILSTEGVPPLRADEPMLAFVHGQLRPRYALRFYRANVQVARFAINRRGYLGAMGVAETPLRFASLSSWESLADAQHYAYGPGEHQPVLRPYKEVPWASDWCVLRLRSLGPDQLLL